MAKVFVELSAASQKAPVGMLVGDAFEGRWDLLCLHKLAG